MELNSTRFNLKQQHLLNCQVANWYPLFKNVTFPTEFLCLPSEFVEYLNEDGVFISKDAFPKRPDVYDRFDVGETPWSDEEEDAPIKRFTELENQIQEVINKLGGSVFPKLNWSCPKDATKFTFNSSLKCSSPSEIILLLKTSDLISHDINEALSNCVDKTLIRPDPVYLTLRRWYSLQESFEFRCFVKDHTLIGISQRHITYFATLKAQANLLKELIYKFFHSQIRHKFPDSNYIFDVYISKNNKVYVIDFNPWADFTEPALFSWDELLNWDPKKSRKSNKYKKHANGNNNGHKKHTNENGHINKDANDDGPTNKHVDVNENGIENGYHDQLELCDFRIISSPSGIRPSVAAVSSVPFDFINWSNNPSSNSSLSDLIEQMKVTQQNEDEE